MQRLQGLWIASLILLSLIMISWKGDDKTEAAQIKVLRLKEEIYSIHLTNQLGLTGHQIEFIIKRNRFAGPHITAYWESLSNIYWIQLRAYTEFKKEDEQNRGFSKEVELVTAKASHSLKRLEEKLKKRINHLAEPILKILTEQQLQLLHDFDRELFQKKKNQNNIFGHGDDWRVKHIKDAVKKAMDMSNKRYKKEKEKIVKDLLNAFPSWMLTNPPAKPNDPKYKKKQKKGESRDDIKNRLTETLDYLRTLPKEDVDAQIDQLIKNKIAPSKKRQLEQKLSNARRSKRDRLADAVRYLLNPDILPYLEKLKKTRPKGEPLDIR